MTLSDNHLAFQDFIGIPFELEVTITQVVGVPTPIGIDWTIPEGQILIIDELLVIAGTLGAGRGIDGLFSTRAGSRVKTLFNISLTTGQFKQMSLDITTTANNSGLTSAMVKIFSNQIFRVSGASLANGETFTINLIGRLLASKLPTHGVAGSGEDIVMVGAGIVDGITVLEWL